MFNEKKIYIYGAGINGKKLKILLKNINLFAGFIDLSEEKQLKGWAGEKVISFEEYCKIKEKNIIVIAASLINEKEISQILNNSGLKLNKDYYTYNSFMRYGLTNYLYNLRKKVFVELAQICLTERCTLKCKKCAHACNEVPMDKADMSLEYAMFTADAFFDKVDYCNEFVLIGGEPFLYKHLKEIIEYIGNKYRSKINCFSITTNGTILPSDDVIELVKKYKMTIRVSDYSYSLPKLKKRYEQFYERVNKCDVSTFTTKDDSWMDYGFGEIDRGDDDTILKIAFKSCNTPCREINGSRYYYCVMAHTVANNKGWDIGVDDYIDFQKVDDIEDIVNFQIGNIKKGYLDMCRYCRGMVEGRDFLIPAAEQM